MKKNEKNSNEEIRTKIHLAASFFLKKLSLPSFSLLLLLSLLLFPVLAMFKRRDWRHLHGADGGDTSSSSDDEGLTASEDSSDGHAGGGGKSDDDDDDGEGGNNAASSSPERSSASEESGSSDEEEQGK